MTPDIAWLLANVLAVGLAACFGGWVGVKITTRRDLRRLWDTYNAMESALMDKMTASVIKLGITQRPDDIPPHPPADDER